MKIQFRSILFALVLPVAACGGDRETPTIDISPIAEVVQPEPDAPVTLPVPVASEPKVIDVAAPMPTKYDELLTLGKDLVGKKSFGDAKLMFEAAAKLETKQAEPHIELARMYIALNERGLSVAAANKAVKLAPLSSLAWNTKGRAELNAHKYEEAIEAFTKAVELNDTNVFAWNNLGYTELLLERFEDAAEHLIEATSRPGATGYMFNNLGTALEHLDQLDEARMAYEAGGQLGSTSAANSRKRLEGVETIAIAKADDDAGEVHEDVRAESPVMEYDLTDEGEVDVVAEEPVAEEPVAVEGSVDEDLEDELDDELDDESDLDEEPEIKPGDNATL